MPLNPVNYGSYFVEALVGVKLQLRSVLVSQW